MKTSGYIRWLVVVCLCLTVVTSGKEAKKKRRGCKCMQRFLKEVDKMVERKMKKFEEKYFLPGVSGQGNVSRVLSREERRWMKLTGDVHFTKDALQKMSKNLQYVTDQVNAQKQDSLSLNKHLNQLNLHVHNLSRVVERLEQLMTRQTEGGTTPTPLHPNEPPTHEPSYPRHCDEVYRHGGLKFQGDYHLLIKPDGAPAPFKVVCRPFNNSGWTVFQRRQDGSVDFYRNWKDYKQGFGDMHSEFWLGNEHLHHLTKEGNMMLRIEMGDWDNKQFHAIYDRFSISNETKHYKLHVGGYHGNAGDSLTSHWENHNGMAFSTKDRDNDGRYYDSCAKHFHGAWWFNNCFDSHLNGNYYTKGFHRNFFQRDGIQWNSIHQYSSLKNVEMMVKPAPTAPRASSKISNDL